MQSQRRRNSRRRGRNPRRGQRRSTGIPPVMMLQREIVRIRVRATPFEIASTTSGTGGFTTLGSGASLTAANSFQFNPYNVGSRLLRFASQFFEWRCVAVRAEYHPYNSISGVISITGASTTTPSYAHRTFAMGYLADPAFGSDTFGGLLQETGVSGETSRPKSFVVRDGRFSEWRYTSTTSGSPTNIDLRMVSYGTFRWYFSDTSSVATTHGLFLLDGVYEFRGPLNNSAPIGLASAIEQLGGNVSVQAPRNGVESKTATLPANAAGRGWF